MKKCSVCGEIKVLEDFVKSKTIKDGRRNQCKACINLQKRLKAEPINTINRLKKEIEVATKKEQLLKTPYKICFTCNKEKDKNQFTKDISKIDGLHSSCKECKNAKAIKDRLDNLEYKRARDRLYGAANKKAKAISDAKYRETNKEKLAANKKVYYENNKEKLKESNRKLRLNRTPEQIKADRVNSNKKYLTESNFQKQRRKEYGKEYHKTPSGKLSSLRNAHKRRALKLTQDDGTITSQALEELKELQEHKCYYCKTQLDYSKDKAVHLDHYIPLSEGGLHSITNVVWSCGPCNWSKGSTIPDQPLKIPSKSHL